MAARPTGAARLVAGDVVVDGRDLLAADGADIRIKLLRKIEQLTLDYERLAGSSR